LGRINQDGKAVKEFAEQLKNNFSESSEYQLYRETL